VIFIWCRKRCQPFIFTWCFQQETGVRICAIGSFVKGCTRTLVECPRNWSALRWPSVVRRPRPPARAIGTNDYSSGLGQGVEASFKRLAEDPVDNGFRMAAWVFRFFCKSIESGAGQKVHREPGTSPSQEAVPGGAARPARET